MPALAARLSGEVKAMRSDLVAAQLAADDAQERLKAAVDRAVASAGLPRPQLVALLPAALDELVEEVRQPVSKLAISANSASVGGFFKGR